MEFENLKQYVPIMVLLKKMSAAQTVIVTWQEEY
jgi:hypothetical protein